MAKEERAAGYEAARHARPQRIARLDLYPTAAVPNVHGLVSRRELLRRGSSLFRSSFWGELSQLCWFGFDSADRHVFRRYSTIPQHDRVGFVVGDALDHAAPITLSPPLDQTRAEQCFSSRACTGTDSISIDGTRVRNARSCSIGVGSGFSSGLFRARTAAHEGVFPTRDRKARPCRETRGTKAEQIMR